jgi:hypothetical protein
VADRLFHYLRGVLAFAGSKFLELRFGMSKRSADRLGRSAAFRRAAERIAGPQNRSTPADQGPSSFTLGQ